MEVLDAVIVVGIRRINWWCAILVWKVTPLELKLIGTAAKIAPVPQGQLLIEGTLRGDYCDPAWVELLSGSDLSSGERLLTDDEALALSATLEQLHEHFTPTFDDTSGANALDVEFLIAGPQRDLIIVQARPFRLVFDATSNGQ